MKRIKAACLAADRLLSAQGQACPSELDKKQVRKEYEAYKEKMTRQHTQFKILEESVQPDGSIIVKLKKQNNQQAIRQTTLTIENCYGFRPQRRLHKDEV